MGLDFSVRHNVDAMFAHRQATLNNLNLTKALERLSSGYRINRASDDAAGLAVSEKLRTQVRGFQQAARNIQDGISMIQVAEAGLQEVSDILQRVRELSVQAASGILTESDRSLLQLEVDQLMNEVNRSMTSIEFNKLKLLDGTFSSTAVQSAAWIALADRKTVGNAAFQGSLVFHVGANEGQAIRAFISTTSVQALGLNGLFSSAGAVTGDFHRPLDPVGPGHPVNATLIGKQQFAMGIGTQKKAESAIGMIDSAINSLIRRRGVLGAVQNRLEHSFNFVGIAKENLQAAESRIRDTDMAEEIVNFTKSQVLVQASQAMLAQANLKTTSILQLLGG